MKDFKQVEQGSPEWYQVRFGRFTASKIAVLISAPNKKGEYKLTKGAKTYIEHCTMEQILQEPLSDYKSDAMVSGSDNEINSAKAYQKKNGVFAMSTGFWCFGDHSGASPDKLVGTAGGAEFKNVAIKRHTKFLTMQEASDLKAIEKDYFFQVHMCMLATGRKWWDFVSYCPHKKLPEHLHIAQLRINRDEKVIEAINACLALAITYKKQLLKQWGIL